MKLAWIFGLGLLASVKGQCYNEYTYVYGGTADAPATTSGPCCEAYDQTTCCTKELNLCPDQYSCDPSNPPPTTYCKYNTNIGTCIIPPYGYTGGNGCSSGDSCIAANTACNDDSEDELYVPCCQGYMCYDNANGGTCVPGSTSTSRSGEGELCLSDVDCDGRAICDNGNAEYYAGANLGTCVFNEFNLPGEYESCQITTECYQSYCDTTVNVCQPLKSVGDSCTAGDSECNDLTYCDTSNYCTALPDEVDEDCSDAERCGNNLYCDPSINTCKEKFANGQSCSYDTGFECLSGLCSYESGSLTCVECLSTDKVCQTDSVCCGGGECVDGNPLDSIPPT